MISGLCWPLPVCVHDSSHQVRVHCRNNVFEGSGKVLSRVGYLVVIVWVKGRLYRYVSESSQWQKYMCVFSEEEINNMKLELDKYGIHLPAFNKIGGILAKELSVDEAAGRCHIGCEFMCGSGQKAWMVLLPLLLFPISPCSCDCYQRGGGPWPFGDHSCIPEESQCPP